MMLHLHAACGCSMGNVRKNNEDNFYFNGRGLEMKNEGMRGSSVGKYQLDKECCFAVFDGMGGEEYGEVASFFAMSALKEKMNELKDIVVAPREFLEETCEKMNSAVCDESNRLCSGRMGSTATMLFFVPDEVYVCNLGDSRAYRIRDNELMQISKDHVEKLPDEVVGKRKARLTQHLGVSPENMRLEPYIAKGSLHKGDIYLICSDGLTDMLSNVEIVSCLKKFGSVRRCVVRLIAQALKNGGKDNVTAIVIKVV